MPETQPVYGLFQGVRSSDEQKETTSHPSIWETAPAVPFFSQPLSGYALDQLPSVRHEDAPAEVALVIHIEPRGLLSLNKTCRYCPHCDLLIAHQDDIEHILTTAFSMPGTPVEQMMTEAFSAHNAQQIGHGDYLVVGTLEKAAWRFGAQHLLTLQETLGALHDFREDVTFKVTGGWMPRNPGSRFPTQV